MAIDANYVCSLVKPDDFDEFWSEVMEDSNKVGPDYVVEKDDLRSTDEVGVYQVFYSSIGNIRVSGWYAKPIGDINNLPAIVLLPGYQSDPPIPKDWAKNGYACFSVSPRGKVRSRSQFDPGYPGLLTHGITSRDEYSYKGFYVDAWKAVDFLKTCAEVDENRIGVTGSSQGGGLTVILAAMRSEIKAAAAGAPYLCGFMDAIQLTNTYPYQEINDYLRTYPEARERVRDTLAYFDGISFADKILCPIIVNIGLRDNVCPPETGYALFERIASTNKRLYEYNSHGHDAGGYLHNAIIQSFFDGHLK